MKYKLIILLISAISMQLNAQEELSKEAPTLRIRLNMAMYADYFNRMNAIYDSPELLRLQQITSGGFKIGIDYRTRARTPLGSDGVDLSLIAGGNNASFKTGIPGTGPGSYPSINSNDPAYFECRVFTKAVEVSPQVSVFYVYGSEDHLEFHYGVGINFMYQTSKLSLSNQPSEADTLQFIPRGVSGYSSPYSAFHTSAEFFLGFKRSFKRLAFGANFGIAQHLLGTKGYHINTAFALQGNIIYSIKQF